MSVDRIATKGMAQSLLWDGDELVDVVGGWRRWLLDGTSSPPRIGWGYPFDRVLESPSSRFHFLYAERGTKAIVLDGGKVARELNRSYVHAEDYDYPAALGRLPDGREVIAHCPDQYNILEIDDLESGERLTRGHRAPLDVFHSGLSISPDGRHMLATGWVWHPHGISWVFDLERALADPSVLDGRGIVPLYEAVDAEVGAACWLDGDRIVMATTTEEPLAQNESDVLGPGQIGVWSIAAARWLHCTTIGYRVGTMIACDDRVLALHGHPRLVDPLTGAVVAEWPDVEAGVKELCFGVEHVPTPIVALHPDKARLAIAQADAITIIQLPAKAA